MSIRLVYIATGITGSGGVSRIMSEKVSAFCERGISICIVSTNDESDKCFYNDLHQAELVFYPHKINTVKAIGVYYRFVQTTIIDIFQPTVVLVIDNGIKGYFAPWYLSKKHPVYFECHGTRNFLKLQTTSWFKQHITLFITGLLSFRFAGVVVLNQQTKQDWYGRKIIVIPNFITILSNESGKAGLLNRKAIAISRISPEKNIETLLKIWATIHTIHPTWTLEICGGGAMEYVEKLQSMAIGVVWHGEVKEVESYISKADFMLHCSVMEGMPMVFLEAMNHSKPVVAFDIDYGPADLIQNGNNGFLVPKNQVNKYIECINNYIQQPELIKEMGANAYSSLARFEREGVVKQWISFFESI